MFFFLLVFSFCFVFWCYIWYYVWSFELFFFLWVCGFCLVYVSLSLTNCVVLNVDNFSNNIDLWKSQLIKLGRFGWIIMLYFQKKQLVDNKNWFDWWFSRCDFCEIVISLIAFCFRNMFFFAFGGLVVLLFSDFFFVLSLFQFELSSILIWLVIACKQ